MIWEGNSVETIRRDGVHEEDWTRTSLALEVVCASIALGQSSPESESRSLSHGNIDMTKLSNKPVVPNGYFSVDGGDLKAGT